MGILSGVLLAITVGDQEPLQSLLAPGGGLVPMVHQVILILVAGAFNGIMEITGTSLRVAPYAFLIFILPLLSLFETYWEEQRMTADLADEHRGSGRGLSANCRS